MAEKKFMANIKLVNSAVLDSNGNQISLTSEERLAISGAEGGPATSSNPLITKTKFDNEMNSLRAGVRWRNPVKYVGYRYDVLDTQPGSPTNGTKYVNKSDGKLYTYTTQWDTGVLLNVPGKVENHEIRILNIVDSKYYVVSNGVVSLGVAPTGLARFLDLVTNKIFNFNTTWDSGETPEENWTVEESNTDEQWTYDADDETWICNSAGRIPYASTVVSGKVKFAPNGGTNGLEAVQANDSRLIKGFYTQTLSNPVGTIEVTHNLNTSKIFVQGWSSGEVVDLAITKNSSDPTNKLDIAVNGTPSSVDIIIIGLP